MNIVENFKRVAFVIGGTIAMGTGVSMLQQDKDLNLNGSNYKKAVAASASLAQNFAGIVIVCTGGIALARGFYGQDDEDSAQNLGVSKPGAPEHNVREP